MFDSVQEAELFGRDLSNEIKSAIERRCRPIENRFAALEARLARLEGAADARASSFKYVGVFKEGRAYEPDQLATYDGGLWHCNARTTTAPGNGAAAWTLAVKCGRDGRDAKGAT